MHICAYCVCVCFRVTVFAFGNFLVVCKKKKKKKKKKNCCLQSESVIYF